MEYNVSEERERQALAFANAAHYKMRASEEVNQRKVVSKKKSENSTVIIACALTILAATAILGYHQVESELKGKIVDPRTGYVTTSPDGIKNPTFQDVIEELKNKGR